jgi:RimJ/RimL family protein N-acetyltransferase
VARFVASRIPGGFRIRPDRDYRAIGFVRGGKLLAGVILHDFREFDVSLSVAAEGKDWPVIEMLRFIAHLVFQDWGCTRMTVLISQKNKRAREFARKVGFKEEGCMEAGFDGKVNGIIYGLTRQGCRWLKKGG